MSNYISIILKLTNWQKQIVSKRAKITRTSKKLILEGELSLEVITNPQWTRLKKKIASQNFKCWFINKKKDWNNHNNNYVAKLI